MASAVKSVRVDSGTASDIARLLRGRKTTFSALAGELLAEAVKMRRCPGVVFADGPAGRRARLEGTGLEVWEVVASYLALGEDGDRLQAAYPWLSDRQLLSALGYFRAYPTEIRDLVAANEGDLCGREELPFARRLAG